MFDFNRESASFTIRDAIEIADDDNTYPTGDDLATVIEDGIENDYLPNCDYYHALARAARRIPTSSIRRMIEARPPFA